MLMQRMHGSQMEDNTVKPEKRDMNDTSKRGMSTITRPIPYANELKIECIYDLSL